MNEKFFSLDQEKQERIINAALKEFGQKGFQKASTNEIVKEAGISKGLLFHYFNNKKGLYLFLFDYAVDRLVERIFSNENQLMEDVFERFLQITIQKLHLFKKHPDLLDFLMTAMDDETIQYDLKNREMLEQAYQRVFAGIDYSRFKSGIDIEKALKVIFWTFQGFGEEEQENLKQLGIQHYDINRVKTRMEDYIQLLRQLFYE
ncbi:MAG: TetR/AcrR family transcriptional regulator [Bacillaceae bacterium]|nr:TetR/AcrR family transcriptional regulator [Bacillaceae bacterium]